jgi:hypothetical protein
MTNEAPYANSSSGTPFYIRGGTLPGNAKCYVERHADNELYDSLSQGKYCYVLTARQVGKSSLMIRVAARLESTGVTVAVLDLTGAGQNLSADQWYYGLLEKTGERLKLEDELEDYWVKHTALGPLARWMGSIRSVVLDRYPGKIVIFIDEVDQVRSLQFPTDEFFAGIREFHNRRQLDQDLNRLTFCLLGAARPSDLVKNPRLTPFTIAKRIDLTDFTESEAGPLAIGLSDKDTKADALIKRVLYWTGGHPYLTQALCQALADEGSVRGDEGVDRVCERLFLSSSGREKDDNLQWMSNRILDKDEDTAGLLTLYATVHRHKCPDDNGSPVSRLWHRNMSIGKDKSSLQEFLEITGLVHIVERCLRVRNRVYHRVFDRRWVDENMPQNELTKQLAAYRKKLSSVAAIAGLLFLVAAYAFFQSNRAKTARAAAEYQQREADRQRQRAVEALTEAEKRGAEAAHESMLRDQAEQLAKNNAWQANLMTWQMIMNDTNPLTYRAYLDILEPDRDKDFVEKANKRLREVLREVRQAAPGTQDEIAQMKGVIRGRVYDTETNKPIAGAQITARKQGVDWELTMFSNGRGEFMLAPMPQGSYVVTISAAGYAERKINDVQVSSDTINKIKPQLGGLSKKESNLS